MELIYGYDNIMTISWLYDDDDDNNDVDDADN